MTNLVSHVAVVSADESLRQHWVTALAECSVNDPGANNICGYRFLPCESSQQARQLAAEDGLLQAVIIDAVTIECPDDLIRAMQESRAELDLFLAVEHGVDVSGLAVELLDRNDDNISHLFRQIQSAIQHRANTPFADTLRDYVYSAKDAWHTPGHSGGDSLRDSPWVSSFHQMMGEHIFNTDLSVSVQVLDSLLEPHSVIQEAQDLAAEAFGAKETFFVTNGTSTANKVIIQHLLGAGGKMIVDQACHKSIHHAIILFGVEPVYLQASLKEEFGFYGPVPKQRIYDAIENNADARLLVLTSCTYDGFYYDLKPIIEYAHQHGMKVLIDEAWYAHGRFHPSLRPNALESGADYVTQSTHKMLSAFSQASMIHVADPDFDEHRFREDLNMHTSTSPQYAMIASLDVARKQMSMEGFLQLSNCIDISTRLREGINSTGVFRVLELQDMLPEELQDDGIRLDPSKLSIDISGAAISARELQLELFESYGIQVEKVTHNTLSVLVTLGSTESKVLRLLNAFQKISRTVSTVKTLKSRTVPPIPQLSAFHVLPREAYFGRAKEVSLLADEHGLNADVIGATSADLVVPYPPGIPVLIPGQEITDSIARFLLNLYHSKNGMEIHGLVEHSDNAFLRVVDQ
jgi:arginine/lysine/ornithine decarboxylase